jgi:ribosomal-protein-alanine N-acetyltransferase
MWSRSEAPAFPDSIPSGTSTANLPVLIGTSAGAWRTHGGGFARRGQGRESVMSTGRTEKEQVRVHIRWMIRRDMPEVLQTEQDSFEFAWTEEDFLRCLRQRNCIGMVAEQGEKVVGFMIYELHKAKLHILNFAVHPPCRRAGIGAQMVSKLISKLSSHRRTRITLEVRETNLAAQLFFRTQGFRALRVLRSYYEDSGEDAFLMQYSLGGAASEDGDNAVNRIAQYEEN